MQLRDVEGDLDDALAVVRRSAARAAALGARLVCFPEGFLNGYTRNRELAERRAIALDSSAFSRVLSALAGCTPALVLGLIEAGNDGMPFSTAVVLNGGRVAGIYLKRHPNEDCFAAGTELPVFDVAGLRAAIGVCADARNYEDAALLRPAGRSSAVSAEQHVGH